ncbi:hypothetical protein K3495_g12521 [Podosphaera aphanis]|nr:hypothetical protein K3495_g12521 [Podosphaera aphanis]
MAEALTDCVWLLRFRLSERHRNIYFISIDWSPRDLLSHALGITTVPSYLIFKDSVIVARIVGPHAGPLRSAIETIAEPLSPVTDTADDSSSLTSSQLGDDLIPAAEWDRLQQLHREQQEQLREQFYYLQRTNQREGRPGSADNRSATSNVSQLSLASHLSLSSQSS